MNSPTLDTGAGELGVPASSSRLNHARTTAALVLIGVAYGCVTAMMLPTLPQIQEELGSSTSATAWVLTSFLIGTVVSSTVLGRLGDLFGRRLVLGIALVCVALGSFLGAVAGSLALLIAARTVQSLAGGAFPLCIGIVRDEFPPNRQAFGIGLVSGLVGIFGGVGPALGGLLVDSLGYQSIFWLAGAVSLASAASLLGRRGVRRRIARARIDWVGGMLMAVTLTVPLIGISRAATWGWTSPKTLTLIAVGLLFFPIWILYERRVDYPLVDMRVLGQRVIMATNLVSLVYAMGTFGTMLTIIVLAQEPVDGAGLGLDAAGAGLLLLPQAIVPLVGAGLAASLAHRLSADRILALILVLGGAPALFLVFMYEHVPAILVASFFMGAAVGVAMGGTTRLVLDNVPHDQTSIATGITAVTRTGGSSIGGQVSATILGSQLIAGTALIAESGFELAFALNAALMLGALPIALALGRRRAG